MAPSGKGLGRKREWQQGIGAIFLRFCAILAAPGERKVPGFNLGTGAMKGIGLLFFGSGAVYLLLRMLLGVQMGAARDYTLAPVHNHLNTIGFVTMALMGVFYHLTPRAAASVPAKVHFGLATLGVWTIVPGIAQMELGKGEVLAGIGAVLTAAGAAVFLIKLAMNAFRQQT
jgi:hypothetical protein